MDRHIHSGHVHWSWRHLDCSYPTNRPTNLAYSHRYLVVLSTVRTTRATGTRNTRTATRATHLNGDLDRTAPALPPVLVSPSRSPARPIPTRDDEPTRHRLHAAPTTQNLLCIVITRSLQGTAASLPPPRPGAEVSPGIRNQSGPSTSPRRRPVSSRTDGRFLSAKSSQDPAKITPRPPSVSRATRTPTPPPAAANAATSRLPSRKSLPRTP